MQTVSLCCMFTTLCLKRMLDKNKLRGMHKYAVFKCSPIEFDKMASSLQYFPMWP